MGVFFGVKMALKTTNKNRVKPSTIEAKVELKHISKETTIKDQKYYNDEYIDTKFDYKLFFVFLVLLIIVSFFVI
jgi:hypothetical protein